MFSSDKNSKIKQLNKWAVRDKNNLLLVHTFNPRFLDELSSPLLIRSVEDTFRTWDVISTSLIDFERVLKQTDAPLKFGQKKIIDTGLYFEVGFILDVPYQNILGTFTKDVWFPNHAGMTRGKCFNSFALADNILSGQSKKRGMIVEGGYNQIQSPRKILKNTKAFRHNEILVIGRPGVNLYPGVPPTGTIKLKKIIIAPKKQDSHSLFNRMGVQGPRTLATLLENANRGVPILHL